MTEPSFVVEIEQQLLGAVLSGGDQRPTLARLTEDHFVEPSHRQIWRMIRQADDQYGSTNMPIVAKLAPPEFLQGFADRSGVSLNAYMAQMVSETMHSERTMRTATKAVLGQWARIALHGEAQSLADAAVDPAANPADLARTVVAHVDEVMSHLRAGHRAKTRMHIVDAAETALVAGREARARQGLVGITSGLVDLDRATGGFMRRDLSIIGARPGMGKTTLATNLARAAAQAGEGVGIFSLEMDNPKLAARFATDIAQTLGTSIAYQDLLNGHLTDEQDRAVSDALDTYRQHPIWTEDSSGLTIAEIRAKTEQMIEGASDGGFKLGMVIVDHLGKVRPSSRYAGNRNNEIGEITDGLKELAREHDLAVVLLSQLSRAVEGRDDKRPQLSDLRDSGAIEQDADFVAFLYREAYYLEKSRPESLTKRIEWEADVSAVRHKAELSIAKQRNGPLATIDLWIDVRCSAIRNAARGI